MPAARSPSTAQAVSSGEDARPCSAKPRTKQTSANGSRRRRNGAASAPTAPQPPHASICHGVQGPCPRTKFETSAAIPPTATPARSPSATPAATVITVTGWTPGIAARASALGNEGLASRVEAHDAIRHGGCEDEVVRDDEGGATRSLAAQPRRQLDLPLRVDAARRLVQDEQVRLGHRHGPQGAALALAARQVAGVPVRGAGE